MQGRPRRKLPPHHPEGAPHCAAKSHYKLDSQPTSKSAATGLQQWVQSGT